MGWIRMPWIVIPLTRGGEMGMTKCSKCKTVLMTLIGGARAKMQAKHRARPTEMSRDYLIALFMPDALWKHGGSAADCSYF